MKKKRVRMKMLNKLRMIIQPKREKDWLYMELSESRRCM